MQKKRNINTTLTERGYYEVIDNKTVGKDEIFKSQIWFYGELE